MVRKLRCRRMGGAEVKEKECMRKLRWRSMRRVGAEKEHDSSVREG